MSRLESEASANNSLGEQKATPQVIQQSHLSAQIPATLAPTSDPPSLSPARQPPRTLSDLEALRASIAAQGQKIEARRAEIAFRLKELERRLEARDRERAEKAHREALIENQAAVRQFTIWACTQAIRAERPEYDLYLLADRERRREEQREAEDRPNFLLWLIWLILAYALFQI